jgi:hypothetical protein
VRSKEKVTPGNRCEPTARLPAGTGRWSQGRPGPPLRERIAMHRCALGLRTSPKEEKTCVRMASLSLSSWL